jgi:TorA maturation chaperone TorD
LGFKELAQNKGIMNMLENHQRQDLYRIFAKIFSYPDPSLIEDLGAEVATLVGLLSVDPPAFGTSPLLSDLQVGYTELFISKHGGVPAPPYGSVYLEEAGQLMGQTTLCVLQAYEGEGLSHEEGGEPPDLISTELEFLYYLVGKEMAALSEDDLSTAHTYRQKQIDFCHTLLQPWVKQFCQRVLQVEDAVPLYRWSAEMLLTFCRHEEELYGVS